MIAKTPELPMEVEPAENYLNVEHSIRSWLLTTDHKRIGFESLVYRWRLVNTTCYWFEVMD